MRQRIPRRGVIRGDVNVAASLAARLDLAREPRPPGGAVFRKTGRRRFFVRPTEDGVCFHVISGAGQPGGQTAWSVPSAAAEAPAQVSRSQMRRKRSNLSPTISTRLSQRRAQSNATKRTSKAFPNPAWSYEARTGPQLLFCPFTIAQRAAASKRLIVGDPYRSLQSFGRPFRLLSRSSDSTAPQDDRMPSVL